MLKYGLVNTNDTLFQNEIDNGALLLKETSRAQILATPFKREKSIRGKDSYTILIFPLPLKKDIDSADVRIWFRDGDNVSKIANFHIEISYSAPTYKFQSDD